MPHMLAVKRKKSPRSHKRNFDPRAAAIVAAQAVVLAVALAAAFHGIG
jgi:hypothetical protein